MQDISIITPSIAARHFGRWLLAGLMVLALTFNPVAMRGHMASAATPTGTEMALADMSAALHQQHQADLANASDTGTVCPQMAPCTALLSAPSGVSQDAVLLVKLTTPLGTLASSRAQAPPFHPPIL